MRPRRLELQELIRVLVEEHGRVKALLTRLNGLLQEGRYGEAAEELVNFKPYLDQHIIDEEASILKLLLEEYGRMGAERAVKVFQEHREIHRLISEMQSLASSSPERLAELRDGLRDMLERHFRAEEGEIFPWALETYRKRCR
ncbi:MAG: hemerythrin domain-containing protein [Nitrososphaerota archaeon]|nr:hemerythrin domain-containing protein [Candidatus Calditenuaceae archaeon]MDW8074044.1 hemerythrin domain-containing protein [Nitrososphaerota archaeon]